MATNLAVNQIVQTKAYCRLDAQIGINVWHYLVTGIVGAPTDAHVAAQVDGVVGTLYKSAMSKFARYQGVTAQIIKPTMYIPSQNNTSAGIGINDGDPIPAQAAGLVSLRSDLSGRKNRGRKYIPFPPEDYNNTSGDPSIDYQGILAGFASFWTSNLEVDGGGGNTAVLKPVVYHRATGTTTALTSYVVRKHWATQRRRGELNRGDVGPFD